MKKLKPLVIVIEDDAKLRRLLRFGLMQAGFDVRDADTGRAGLVVAATRRADLVILDLGLPDIDGAEVIQKIREWWSTKPIIILSGRDSEVAKVAALELGADDYVTKPFGLPELVARVRAALRRSARRVDPEQSGQLTSHGVLIDTIGRQVMRDGREIALTQIEFRLLAMLARNAGLPVTTQQLVNELWGPNSSANNRNYLRTYLSTLRQKLERDPAQPRMLLTEAGVGYRLALDPEPEPESEPGPGTSPETPAPGAERADSGDRPQA